MKEMRRTDKEIGTDEAVRLLTECEYGVLSTVGNDGQAYGVPLNYVYKDNCIYFHCALSGHLSCISGHKMICSLAWS